MIPRRLRLPRKKIDHLFRKGNKSGNDFLTIRYYRTPEAKSDNYCVVISAATEKSAVKRNGVRRKIYEIVRLKEKSGDLKGKKTYAVAVICKKKLCGLDYGRIEEKLNDLLNKLPR